MILPSVFIIFLNDFVMVTLAEPSSPDSGQQRLTAQCGEVPVVIHLSEQKLEESLLSDFNVTNHASNGTSTNGKTSKFGIGAVNEVPEIIFSDLPQHKKVMELLLEDIQRGSHLLLVENRGIENKKIADGLLKHLNRPTQYIQLNRNTTIQSLTEQPNDKNRTVINEDSPLFKAVKYGYVLVVDDVDKAPKTVRSSLNNLMENGKMILSDGRRIIPKGFGNSSEEKSAGFINVHEDFRMIVTARESGFPVLEKNEEIEARDVRRASALPMPENHSRRRRFVASSRNGEIGLTVKAVGSSPKITTVVMGAQGTGPHTATAVASGRAVATATAITYGRGSSTATATASGSSKATAVAHSYDAGVATATVTTSESSVGDATADAYNTGGATATLTCTGSSNAGAVARAQDSGVATATATTSATASVNVQAFARGNEVITDTKTRP
ncbi:unnamed protein product [Parnassius apollo]|uniref:(apollo) hypothetical protein n=1 Tax=Parnassius apollo TaxID=110799 RepID=A0A8S3XXV0_PARAO|nr:unnamed protein product [Parnassius apollo]